MKTFRIFSLMLFGFLGAPVVATAQISDNDASISVLAVQCAVSSGFSASDYEDYCRRLAKTLSLLSSDQQTRVFGYLPMPGAASLGRTPPKDDAETSGNGDQSSTEAGSTKVGDSNPSDSESNGVLDLVGRFNSLFDGTASASVSTPVISAGVEASVGSSISSGGSTLSGALVTTTSVNATASSGSDSTSVGSNATTSTGGSSKTSDSGSSKGWSSLVAWFEAAEAAYKAGTLSSFLRGGK